MFLFVVEAASPRGMRYEWTTKAGYRPVMYIMKPPTLDETLVGAKLQKLKSRPHVLRECYELYGPSAHDLYRMQHEGTKTYAAALTQRILRVTPQTFMPLTKQCATLDQVDTDASHLILLVTPGPTRDSVRVDFISTHVFRLVQQQLVYHTYRNLCRWYKLVSDVPDTSDIASRILERVIHRVLPAGGCWPLKNMEELDARERRRGVTRETGGENYYLVVGGTDTVRISAVLLTTTNNLAVPSFEPFTHHDLEDAYYAPLSKDGFMVDSFIYSSHTHTVTAFQITTVLERHAVDLATLRWLKDLSMPGKGAPSVVYIAVSTRDVLSLPFSPTAKQSVDEVYHLTLANSSIDERLFALEDEDAK